MDMDSLLEKYQFSSTDCQSLRLKAQRVNDAGAAFTLTHFITALKLLSHHFPNAQRELKNIITQTESLIRQLH